MPEGIRAGRFLERSLSCKWLITVAQQSFKPFASSEKNPSLANNVALDLSLLQTASMKQARIVKALKCLSAIDVAQLSAGKMFYWDIRYVVANVVSALPCKNFKALVSCRNTKTRCIRCLEESSYVRDVTSHSVELMVWNVIKNLAASARSAFLSKLFNAKKNFEVTSKNGIRERNGRLMQRNRGKLFIFDFFRMFKTTL